MIGAIIGDIVGSRFEFGENPRVKEFEFINFDCDYTDDTLMTLAVGAAVMECGKDYEALSKVAQKNMRVLAKKYPNPCGGYGSMFSQWLFSSEPRPYGSFGNGAAMRVSACGYFADSVEDAKQRALAVTKITHDHPEGLKGAEATAVAIRLAREGKSKEEIKAYIEAHYYKIDFTLEELRKTYEWDGSCQGTVPQAMAAFFESTDFEDAIRNAISIGGDSDTIGAITGSIAEAYYGVPEELRMQAIDVLERELTRLLLTLEKAIKKQEKKD